MARRRRPTAPTGPGAVLGLVTLALSGSAWWLVVRSEPDDDLTVPFVLQIATFAGAAVTAALWRLRAQPAGTQDEDGRRERLPSPPGGLWLLPLGELALFSLTLPVLTANNPGDPTVVGLLFAFTLALGWIGMLGALVAGLLVVLPALVLLRPIWFLVRRTPVTAQRLLPSALSLTWLAFVGTISGAVVGTPASGGRGDISQIGALFGLSEVTSPPWIWFGRRCLVVLVLGGLATAACVRRAPRTPDAGQASRASA